MATPAVANGVIFHSRTEDVFAIGTATNVTAVTASSSIDGS
jgi:hypothetical protein